jgi:hypothetical protein
MVRRLVLKWMGAFKRLFVIRVGYLLEQSRIAKLRETCELAAPAFSGRLRQFLIVVGEKQKRSLGRRLLTHENERYLRAQELQRDGSL